MRIEIKISPIEDSRDYYNLTMKTYKQEISGKFEKSELRELIEKIDNAII
jgi:hypothetical protein